MVGGEVGAGGEFVVSGGCAGGGGGGGCGSGVDVGEDGGGVGSGGGDDWSVFTWLCKFCSNESRAGD